MKKRTSAALLALQLTWRAAALVLVLGALVQTGLLAWKLMPGGVPLQTNLSFSEILDTSVWRAGMFFAAMLLFAVTFRAGTTRGSKSIYTMKRLGLPEWEATIVFALVFSGYFLLYWAAQVGLCFAWFAWYSRFSLVSSATWMLSVWDSSWLHYLLPMEESVGYVRNLAICLNFGATAAYAGYRERRGKGKLWPFLSLAIVLVLFPQSHASTLDFFLIPFLVTEPVGYFFAMLEDEKHEDAL